MARFTIFIWYEIHRIKLTHFTCFPECSTNVKLMLCSAYPIVWVTYFRFCSMYLNQFWKNFVLFDILVMKHFAHYFTITCSLHPPPLFHHILLPLILSCFISYLLPLFSFLLLSCPQLLRGNNVWRSHHQRFRPYARLHVHGLLHEGRATGWNGALPLPWPHSC